MFFLLLYFERGCSDWLKMAADANSVSIAKERLDIAVKYLEDHHMTSGNSAFLFPVPTTDLAPWYKNLKQAQQNLENFPKNPTETDTSTALVKLRETLLDHTQTGDAVTVPVHAFVYPYQLLWLFCWMVTGTLAFIGGICIMVWANDRM